MGLPVVIKASGGLPVVVSTNGFGVPMTIATNGYGLAITQSTTGIGLPVVGVTFGPDVTAPIITSSNAVSNVESTVLAHTLTANEAVTWAIVAGGADNARFELSGSTLRWLANGVKDFEAPNDADVNNAYVVTVRATDTAANPSLTQTITVTVTNVVSTAPAAPVLDLTTDETDTTPDFTLTGDLVLSDTVRFQYSTSAVFSGASDLTNTIDAAEDTANAISFTTGALAGGTWYFRARIERPDAEGVGISGWSNTETITLTSSTSAEVTQFLARTTGLDGTHTAAYTALIDGLVADGLWAKLDALYIFATQSTANALLNLKSSSYTPTIVGALTFTADDGYTFASGSNYINTNFNASTAGGVYQRDNAHMSVWMFNDNGSMQSAVGTLSGTTQQRIMPHLGGTAYYRLHIVDPDDCNLARATGVGLSIAVRISSTVLGGYLNGAVSPFASATADSVAINNSSFTFPDIAAGEQDTSNIVSGGSFGSQMSAAEQNNFYNRMRAYMTAVGVP